MRKLLPLVTFLLLSTLLFGQKKDISIYWDAKNTAESSSFSDSKVSNRKDKVLSSIHLKVNKDELSFFYQWQDNRMADEKSIEITNIQYGNLTSEERKKVNTALVPDKPEYRLISSRARNITYNSVYMSPVVRVNGQLRKVLSFSVNYKYAVSRNSGSPSIITNSVLATGDWYKFQVEETGVYRVSKSFLDDMGMNTDGIDPRNIRIYGHGGKPLP
ncbi:MAG: peptidase C25, partial [Flavobacteriaceae bacterium]|nr:peptidase C25 [Flavobacteriaceae bacterium]